MNVCRMRKCIISLARYTHIESRNGSGNNSQKKEPKIQNILISSCMKFFTYYQKFLEKRLPSVYHVSRIFMTGMKDLIIDLKNYNAAQQKLMAAGGNFRGHTRKEIEIIYQVPKDIMKVYPTLVMSVIPFSNFLLFPLLYWYPRHLLCSHFWSLQQRVEFSKLYHREKLYNYRPLFRCLQAKLDDCKNSPSYDTWNKVLGLIGSGVHPKTRDILNCIDLFQGEPYSVLHMYSNHVTALLRANGLHTGWRRRTRLKKHAFLIHHMDLAIMREGGPQRLSQDDMRRACLLRGLNPYNVRTEELVEWLEQWLAVSKEIDETGMSLLLHCPIFLAYNKASNWVLIH